MKIEYRWSICAVSDATNVSYFVVLVNSPTVKPVLQFLTVRILQLVLPRDSVVYNPYNFIILNYIFLTLDTFV